MRLKTPRIEPVAQAQWSDAQRAILEPFAARGPVLNIFKTMAVHPEAMKAFLAWGSYILGKGSTLAPRDRELVILRTGLLCRSAYEWTQHVLIGQRAGLTAEEVTRIKLGASAPGWSPTDTALLHACEDLHREQLVSDRTWTELRAHFDERQCMDVVFVVGQYTQVSMMLNSFGVQLEDGQTLDPDLED